LLERERERAQKHYAEETKYFRDNAAMIQEQLDADRDRQLKEMRTSVFGMLTGNMSPQKPPEQGTAAGAV
jgi:import inner membrane translocase subunit TIM50